MNSLSLIKQDDKRKNSLIEVLRFVMAWSILVFHGFMPFPVKIMDLGVTGVAVDFFLLLGGFLFASSYAGVEHMSIAQGFWSFLAKRLKRLGLPFLISLVFAIYNTITMRHIAGLVGYLWFIPVEIIAQVILYFLIRGIKRKWFLLSILIVFAILGYSYFYALPPDYTLYPQGGYNIFFVNLWAILGYPLRGIGGVFVGYALTYIPKIKNKIITTSIALLAFFALLLVTFWTYFPYKEFVFIFLAMMAIYFLMQIKFSFPLLDFFGAISFGLYIFQTLGSTLRLTSSLAPHATLMIIIAVSVLSQPQAFANIFKIKKKHRSSDAVVL